MNRISAGVAASATALALVLAGCSGEPDDTSSPGADVDPASLTAELTWWDTSDPRTRVRPSTS